MSYENSDIYEKVIYEAIQKNHPKGIVETDIESEKLMSRTTFYRKLKALQAKGLIQKSIDNGKYVLTSDIICTDSRVTITASKKFQGMQRIEHFINTTNTFYPIPRWIYDDDHEINPNNLKVTLNKKNIKPKLEKHNHKIEYNIKIPPGESELFQMFQFHPNNYAELHMMTKTKKLVFEVHFDEHPKKDPTLIEKFTNRSYSMKPKPNELNNYISEPIININNTLKFRIEWKS